MSVLEGIAALGLACNILQLIGTFASSITVAKNMLTSGTVDPDLEGRDDDLMKLFKDLKEFLSQVPVREDDKNLRDVSGHIFKITDELKTELAKISGSPSRGRIRKVVAGTIKRMPVDSSEDLDDAPEQEFLWNHHEYLENIVFI